MLRMGKSCCLILVLLLMSLTWSTWVIEVHAWAWETHRFVTSEAIDLMPDDLDWFFSTYSSVIIEYSVKPDQWKGSDPHEQYRHWYHVDAPHDESQYGDGVLPWAVEDNFNTFVQYLIENDWDHAAQLAGVISHYIADASMPLHATSDYNPGGNHVAYESTVDSHLYEIIINASGFAPQELENVFDSTMQLLNESYSYTSVLNPYLSQDILWNEEIRDLTENRLRSGAQLLANIWYTAAIQAELTSPSSTSPPTDYVEVRPAIILIVVVTTAGIVLTLYMKRC